MKDIQASAPYYGAVLVDFYVLPFFIRDTGSAMFILLMVMPVVCFAAAFLYGRKNGFRIRFPLVTAGLFVPSIFLFYNLTAWVYIFVFGINALLGELLAIPFRRK